MGIVDVNRNPSRRQLNQFGFIWLAFFALAATVTWVRFHSPALSSALAAAAVVVPAVGWLAPPFMRAVFVGMSLLAWPIGFVVSHLLLGAVYFLLVTPIGLVMRLVGYDPMHRRFDPRAESYWRARDPGPPDPRHYFRQF
jgi:hypothetical protein